MLINDAEWIRQSFLLEKKDIINFNFADRVFTSASLKYVDTTPGGNICINPPPQFTATCDIRVSGKYSRDTASAAVGAAVESTRPTTIIGSNTGLGRYYSEAIDDNSQIIHMRFGVAKFNSLTTFYTSFYQGGIASLVRTGRGHGVMYQLGTLIGSIALLSNWIIPAITLAGYAMRFLMGRPSSKYYYLNPTMPLYWNAVTMITNKIAVNSGLVPRVGGNDSTRYDGYYQFDSAAAQKLHDMLPDVFRTDGTIDVWAMATRAQRLARARYKKIKDQIDDSTIRPLEALRYNDIITDHDVNSSTNNKTFLDYLKTWFEFGESEARVPSTDKDTKETDAYNEGIDPKRDGSESVEEGQSKVSTFFKYFGAELDDGAAFASFRVNSTGPVSESFSNSVGESEIKGKINGMAAAGRTTNFTVMGGKLADIPAIGSVVNAVKDVATGAMDSLGISGLAMLSGTAFVDIPKHWQDSVASLPRANYTVNLVSPYGNPVSQLINIHIPLAMLLAAALPMSTGRASYTSPFLLELYDKGRCQTRLGMIDSLTITRGTSNLGFNSQGKAMAIDVSFSIVDMSSVMHMPLSEGFSTAATNAGTQIGVLAGTVAGYAKGGMTGAIIGAAAGGGAGFIAGSAVDGVDNALKSLNALFQDDDSFNDYMAVLSGMSLQDQIYPFKKLKLRLTQEATNWSTWYSVSHFASFMGGTDTAKMASALFRGTDR